MMIDKQDQIKAYLTDKMDVLQRQKFEISIQRDFDLRKEVEFNKDLMSYLENDKPELEDTLKRLGAKYASDKKVVASKPKINNWWFIAVVVLLFIAIVWYFNRTAEESIEVPINNNFQEELPENIEQQVIENGSVKEQAVEETPTQDGKPIAIIDNTVFNPNAYLEDLITDGIRSDDVEIKIKDAAKELEFKQQEGKAKIRIIGEINKDIPLEIQIFNNSQEKFLDNQFILKADVNKKAIKDEFQFDFYINTSVEKGIYYYLIYNKSNEDLLKISKFYVK